MCLTFCSSLVCSAWLFCEFVSVLKQTLKGCSVLMMPWQPLSHQTFWFGLCLCINIRVYVCLFPLCSLQHCLSRTSPCMWQCLYPILMPCTSQEGLWVARPWQQPQPLSVTVGCCPLHRPLCIGMWAQVEAPKDPPVQAMQVSGPQPLSAGQSSVLRMIQTTHSRCYQSLLV